MSLVSLVSPSASFIRNLLFDMSWPHHDKKAVYPNHINNDTRPRQLEEFDMHPCTGFLPSTPPLERLPPDFDLWELALASASDALSLGEEDSPNAIARRDSSRCWRSQLRNVCLNIFFGCGCPFNHILLGSCITHPYLVRRSAMSETCSSCSRVSRPFLHAFDSPSVCHRALHSAGIPRRPACLRFRHFGHRSHLDLCGYRAMELGSCGFQ